MAETEESMTREEQGPPAPGDETAPPGPPAAPHEVADDEELADLREKWLRAVADLDNFRRRARNQIKAAIENERRTVLGAFLEVIDSLDQGLRAHQGEENEWVEGMKGLHRQILDVLRRLGAEPFLSKGELFDPQQHEAISRTAVPDRPEGTVLDVVQRGYRFADGSLLRPAIVVVSYRPDEGDEAEEGPENEPS